MCVCVCERERERERGASFQVIHPFQLCWDFKFFILFFFPRKKIRIKLHKQLVKPFRTQEFNQAAKTTRKYKLVLLLLLRPVSASLAVASQWQSGLGVCKISHSVEQMTLV